MIVSVAGLSDVPGALGDLSAYLDREKGFTVEASLGNRIDLLTTTFMDAVPGILAIPSRAEVIVYDAPANTDVVDPPNAISDYNKHRTWPGTPYTSTTPSAWTPRVFAGYTAKVKYTVEGRQRYVDLSAQDYTYRLRTTIVNMAFAGGYSDAYILGQIGAKYRSDFDWVSLVNPVATNFPAISFPVHSLEQFLQRVVKITRAFYRVDYYKRMIYGVVGLLTSPINFSDQPNFTSTFPVEGLDYEPDGAGLVNRVWVLGTSFVSSTQTYQIPPQVVDGSHYQFALPGDPEQTNMTVSVGGVDQGYVGLVPGDGDPSNHAGFKYPAVIQRNPPVLLLRTTPANGTAVIVTGKFRYPLVQTVQDASLIQATGGQIFEGTLRDRRIMDLTLAQQAGQNYLTQQGKTLLGGGFLTKYRADPVTQQIVSPGQLATIRNQALYEGLLGGGGVTNSVILTKTTLKLTDDVNQPFEMQVAYADRVVGGGL